MPGTEPTGRLAPWREKLRIVIFEADTPSGKAFDVALLVAIVVSVGIVMAESVAPVRERYGRELDIAEWLFTILFTVEYGLRLLSIPHPARYARSFFGIVDVLAIAPTYFSLLIPGAESLIVIRGLRLLRIFRVFKLGRFLGEASLLTRALLASRHKVIVFLGTVVIVVTILGDDPPCLEVEPLPRVVRVSGVGTLDILKRLIQPLSGRIQALGYAGDGGLLGPLAEAAAELGVGRLAPLGRLAWPPADWRHDGRYQLLPLLTWTEWEAE